METTIAETASEKKISFGVGAFFVPSNLFLLSAVAQF